MQSILKSIIITGLFAFSQQIVFAQDADKTVTLTVTGQGKTIDEAKANALRGAIEQAFGAFISSNTTILNDSLVKDEIVSVTNGNIEKFDILNETTLPNGFNVATLKVTVSVNKLTTFCEAKGIKVEFKGGLFALNMAMQELNEKSEIVAWENTKKIIDDLTQKCFDYNIKVDEPVINENDNRYYNIGISIDIYMNSNYSAMIDLVRKFLSSISLTKNEAETYKSHRKVLYPLVIASDTSYVRNYDKVRNGILSLPWDFAKKSLTNFQINNGIEKCDMDSIINKNSILLISRDEPKSFRGEDYTAPYIVEFVKRRDDDVEYFSEGKNLDNVKVYEPIYIDLETKKRFSKQPLISYLDDIFDASKNWLVEKNDINNISVLNYIDIKHFLNIKYFEVRDLEAIKNITEYKIELKK